MSHARARSTRALWVCAAVSATLHAALVFAAHLPGSSDLAAATELPLQMESLVDTPKVDAPPPPPAPHPEPPPARPRVRTAHAKPTAVSRVASANSIPEGGSLAVASGTSPEPGATGSTIEVPEPDSESKPEPESERKPGPASLSLWMDPQALVRLSLVRPGIAFLMSVPGYRDALRGSGIRPFTDLQRLRVTVSGVTALGLSIAGVHTEGAQALLDIAQRIAAMRDRALIWRGDSQLRATSWVDGSGVDRGLALHDGAFLIAARSELPDMLGDRDPAQRVVFMSQMRQRVVLALTLDDVVRYLPILQSCALQTLRVSIAADGGSHRLALSAFYATPTSAERAPSCLRDLGERSAPLSNLVEWLVRAESAQHSAEARLRKEVTGADIERLLEELAWALRNA